MSKTTTATPKPAAPAAPAPCRCGCGAQTVRPEASYLPGHDARHAGAVGRALLAGADREAALAALPTEALRTKALGVLATAERKAATKAAGAEARKAAQAAAKAAYAAALAAALGE